MLWDKDPNHWKLMIFYYNPGEPRLFVAKRTGTPITLNYGRPMAWAITALPIAALTLAALLNSFHLVR